MKKFILSEEEKSRILNLYEEVTKIPNSKFLIDMSSILGIDLSVFKFIDFPDPSSFGVGEEGKTKWMASVRQYYPNLPQDPKQVTTFFSEQLNSLVQNLLRKIKQDPSYLNKLITSLNSYQGQMTPKQRQWLDYFKNSFTNIQKIALKTQTPQPAQPNTTVQPNKQQPATQTPQPVQPNTTVQPASTVTTQAGDKVNTTNDRSYDYKLSGGKYYYSLKNKNNWVEASGKGLESIKSKVKF